MIRRSIHLARLKPSRSVFLVVLSLAMALLVPSAGAAQGTAADYERAAAVAERTDGLVVDVPETPHWISPTRFW